MTAEPLNLGATKIEQDGNTRGRWITIRDAVLLTIIVAVGWMARTYQADVASYWFDESSSWKTIQYGWGEIFTPISRNVHPPVFYLTLKSWGSMFGDGPTSLRLFSAFFGVLTTLMGYVVVREATNTGSRALGRGHGTAILAAALLAINGMQLFAGVHARMYTLGTFLTLVSVWSAIRILRSGGRPWEWGVCAAAATALTLTHYYGLFTAATIAIGLLAALMTSALRSGWSERTRRLAIGSAVGGWCALNLWGAWLPQFLFQRAQVSQSYHISAFQWDQVARMSLAMVAAPESYSGPVGWKWIAAIWWGAVSLGLLLRRDASLRMIGLAAVLPVVCACAYCLTVRSIFTVRYFLFAQTCLLVAWALTIDGLPWKWLRIGLGLASVGWFGYWSASHLSERSQRAAIHGLRDAVAELERWRSPGDIVMVGQGVIHPTVQQYSSRDRDKVLVVDCGHPYPHFQGGPLLRDEEYLSIPQLSASDAERVFTVDIYDLWGRGSRYDVRLPPSDWKPVRVKWFQEGYGQPCRLFIREYQRLTSQPTYTVDNARRGVESITRALNYE